jgi:hypothetical protein
MVVIAGFLALLVTATIAASYTAQTAKADKNTSPYGQINSQNAQNNQPWGQQVSAGAQDPNTSHNGISDFRANGCKLVGGNNGQGGNIC